MEEGEGRELAVCLSGFRKVFFFNFNYCVNVENCESFRSFGFMYIYIYIYILITTTTTTTTTIIIIIC